MKFAPILWPILSLLATGAALASGPVTVTDAVSMVRIQGLEGDDGSSVASFAPNGTRFISLVWHGDIPRNVNVYDVLRFDKNASGGWSGPKRILTLDYDPGRKLEDRSNQHAQPIKNIQFLPNNVTIAFIGTFNGKPRQVYTLDTTTGALSQLTHSRTDVTAFGLSPQGALAYFASLSSETPADAINKDLWTKRGVSVTQGSGNGGVSVFGLATQELIRFTNDALPWYASAPKSEWHAVLPDGRTAKMPVVELPPTYDLLSETADIAPSGDSVAVSVMGVDESKVPLRFETQITILDLRSRKQRTSLALPIGQSSLVWSPSGKSFVLGPFTIPSQQSVLYREITVATGRASTFTAPNNRWDLRGWSGENALVFTQNRSKVFPTDYNKLALVERSGGGWSSFRKLGLGAHFNLNQRYISTVFGNTIIGVRDGLVQAPEIAAYNLASKKTTTLTDLNPQLRERTFGQVSRIFWHGRDGDDSHFGYLIKPVGYVAGKRYPLVILMKDEGYDSTDNSYLIDGQEQLGAFAAQMLANSGFVVLLTPDPLSASKYIETPQEAPNTMFHVEDGVAYLDRLGLIDPQRVSVSGWSRNAMLTDYMIAHSKIRFAAASDVDGGGNYRLFMLSDRLADPKDLLPDNQVDLHLRDIHTPLMSEEHGVTSLLLQASELISDLQAMNKPAELYFYANAPHNLKSPVQRYFSLTRNVDWYRFWLQGYEDPSPSKAAQYAHWRELRTLHDKDIANK